MLGCQIWFQHVNTVTLSGWRAVRVGLMASTLGVCVDFIFIIDFLTNAHLATSLLSTSVAPAYRCSRAWLDLNNANLTVCWCKKKSLYKDFVYVQCKLTPLLTWRDKKTSNQNLGQDLKGAQKQIIRLVLCLKRPPETVPPAPHRLTRSPLESAEGKSLSLWGGDSF